LYFGPGDEELHSFKSVFKAKMSEGFSDDHIFISVFDRPPYSTFTRVQRITCCATFLYTYIFVNAMWFGLLRTPSEHEQLTGTSPLEWMDVFIGILASVIVFPITLALQQMFRHAKHKVSELPTVSKLST
jgi:succinate dehydrogenase/fumarate reductase cytochrome b subunit